MVFPLALLFVLLQNQAPAVPAIVSDPDYPLRVQLAQTGGSSGTFQKWSAWGHGNVLGSPAAGFDFTADCNERFAPRPEAEQYFRARWKKQGERLEILIQEFGAPRISRCELKVAMQVQPYELNPTGSAPRLASMMPAARPAVPVTEPDANFPLRVQLWVRSMGSSSQFGSHAEGYGNVTGDPAAGFDFANTCPVRLSFGRNGGDVYQARWVEKGLQLEVLVQEVGTHQESVCAMDVGMKAEPSSAPVPGVRPAAPASGIKPRGAQAPAGNSDVSPPQ
jgi:hypothetical protein